jgi:dipeptidyl aminopeptidase/acylaminoacyl peptidase
VLQVNYRASTGFGKKFLHAGDRQWGLKMHNDLIDAVNWAVKQGYADPTRIAIMGGSCGGYATLAGLTYTPDVFAAGVDICGPSNLKTLIGSTPPYWKPIRSMFDARIGNVDDPKDADLIHNASPLFRAAAIKKPLLIGQGANDPRVNIAEAQQVVDVIEKNKGTVTYVALQRRRPRLRPPGKQHRLQRPSRELPSLRPRRPLRTDVGRPRTGIDGDVEGG